MLFELVGGGRHGSARGGIAIQMTIVWRAPPSFNRSNRRQSVLRSSRFPRGQAVAIDVVRAFSDDRWSFRRLWVGPISRIPSGGRIFRARWKRVELAAGVGSRTRRMNA